MKYFFPENKKFLGIFVWNYDQTWAIIFCYQSLLHVHVNYNMQPGVSLLANALDSPNPNFLFIYPVGQLLILFCKSLFSGWET